MGLEPTTIASQTCNPLQCSCKCWYTCLHN